MINPQNMGGSEKITFSKVSKLVKDKINSEEFNKIIKKS
jgi:hypothetical protein